MTQQEVITHIQQFIQQNVLAPHITITETSNLQDAGLDSFSTVEVILFIERQFGVAIPDEHMLPENFKTLQTLAALVLQLKN